MSLLDGLHTTRIPLSAGTVRVLSAGEGPCVLFVHGWPMHAGLWRHAMRALASTHRVIALDLPASGDTTLHPDADLSLSACTALLDELMDALDVTTTGLCVHDAGGPIGLHWAARWSGRIERLCLLNTLVFPELSWAARAFFASARLPGADTWVMNPTAVRMTLRLGVRSRRPDPEVAASYAEPFRDPEHRRTFIRAVRSFDPDVLATLPVALDRIAHVPLRLLYGTRDHILPDVSRTMERLRARYPHAESTAWPDLGHFLQEDAPERVADAIAAFFRNEHP